MIETIYNPFAASKAAFKPSAHQESMLSRFLVSFALKHSPTIQGAAYRKASFSEIFDWLCDNPDPWDRAEFIPPEREGFFPEKPANGLKSCWQGTYAILEQEWLIIRAKQLSGQNIAAESYQELAAVGFPINKHGFIGRKAAEEFLAAVGRPHAEVAEAPDPHTLLWLAFS